MQHRTRRYTLYFRFVISLLLSISVSLLLIIITSKHEKLQFSSNKTKTIADRIVLFVRSSHNCQLRLNYLLQSWITTNLSQQSNLYLVTDNGSNNINSRVFKSFRNVIQTNCPQTHGRFDLCCKTAHEFQLFYNLTKRKSNLEWMCRFDDDQYVNLNNLYEYLSRMNPSKPYYIGRTSHKNRMKVRGSNRTYSFATYGGGVCFSHTLLKQLRPHVDIKALPHGCIQHGISDDGYIGYLTEFILNLTLTSENDLFHSHLEILDKSFRQFSLKDLSRFITLGFAWDRYKLEWLPIIHQLIQLVHQEQFEAASRLWLFLRTFEKEHPEDLTDKYDDSCLSYQRLRNQSIESRMKKNKVTPPHPIGKS